MAAIDERLSRLLDREDIRDALLRYTRGIDRHDADIMGAAYHSGATDDHGAYKGTAADFVRYANDIHADGFLSHHHYVGNHVIDLAGDEAHVETYFLASLRRKDGPTILVGGRYIDRLERREGLWAIVHRRALVEWAGELGTSDFVEGLSLDQGKWNHGDLSYERPLSVGR